MGVVVVFMVVINAIVYKSEEDGGYVARAYEVTQIGVGETKEVGLTRIMTEPSRHKPIIREINDYGLTLQVYDLSD